MLFERSIKYCNIRLVQNATFFTEMDFWTKHCCLIDRQIDNVEPFTPLLCHCCSFKRNFLCATGKIHIQGIQDTHINMQNFPSQAHIIVLNPCCSRTKQTCQNILTFQKVGSHQEKRLKREEQALRRKLWVLCRKLQNCSKALLQIDLNKIDWWNCYIDQALL